MKRSLVISLLAATTSTFAREAHIGLDIGSDTSKIVLAKPGCVPETVLTGQGSRLHKTGFALTDPITHYCVKSASYDDPITYTRFFNLLIKHSDNTDLTKVTPLAIIPNDSSNQIIYVNETQTPFIKQLRDNINELNHHRSNEILDTLATYDMQSPVIPNPECATMFWIDYVKDVTENFMAISGKHGLTPTVTKASLIVPRNFDYIARLKLERILSAFNMRPAAMQTSVMSAALELAKKHYDTHKGNNATSVILLDIGQTSARACKVVMQHEPSDKRFRIISEAGCDETRNVSGDRITDLLLDHVIRQNIPGCTEQSFPYFYTKMFEAAEKLKKTLSEKTSSKFSIRYNNKSFCDLTVKQKTLTKLIENSDIAESLNTLINNVKNSIDSHSKQNIIATEIQVFGGAYSQPTLRKIVKAVSDNHKLAVKIFLKGDTVVATSALRVHDHYRQPLPAALPGPHFILQALPHEKYIFKVYDSNGLILNYNLQTNSYNTPYNMGVRLDLTGIKNLNRAIDYNNILVTLEDVDKNILDAYKVDIPKDYAQQCQKQKDELLNLIYNNKLQISDKSTTTQSKFVVQTNELVDNITKIYPLINNNSILSALPNGVPATYDALNNYDCNKIDNYQIFVYLGYDGLLKVDSVNTMYKRYQLKVKKDQPKESGNTNDNTTSTDNVTKDTSDGTPQVNNTEKNSTNVGDVAELIVTSEFYDSTITRVTSDEDAIYDSRIHSYLDIYKQIDLKIKQCSSIINQIKNKDSNSKVLQAKKYEFESTKDALKHEVQNWIQECSNQSIPASRYEVLHECIREIKTLEDWFEHEIRYASTDDLTLRIDNDLTSVKAKLKKFHEDNKDVKHTKLVKSLVARLVNDRQYSDFVKSEKFLLQVDDLYKLAVSETSNTKEILSKFDELEQSLNTLLTEKLNKQKESVTQPQSDNAEKVSNNTESINNEQPDKVNNKKPFVNTEL